MLRLDATTKIFQLTATATADVDVSGLNVTATAAAGFNEVTAATASTQTVAAAPAASTVKQVDYISIKNTGAGANTVTVKKFNSSGPVTTQLAKATLAVDETLIYTHAGGWQTLDATGSKKVGTAGWVIAAGKIGTLSNSLTFTGTDGSTLAIGTGGTLGTAAYTASTAYEASGGIATHAALTATHGASGAIVGTTDAQALTNKTYNGHTFTAGSSTFTGTAAQTYTFPTTTASIARTDAAQSFTGLQTFSTGITSTAASNSFGATVFSGAITGGQAATLGATTTTTLDSTGNTTLGTGGSSVHRFGSSATYAVLGGSGGAASIYLNGATRGGAAGSTTANGAILFATDEAVHWYNSSVSIMRMKLDATALTLGSGITSISGGTNPSLNIGSGSLTAGTGTFSGNVAVGVASSGWAGPIIRALEVGYNNTSTTSVSTYNATNVASGYIQNNAYFNGTNWIYQTANYAAAYNINNNTGTHSWLTAPSGTAGNPITFTERMVLSSTGLAVTGTLSANAFTIAFPATGENAVQDAYIYSQSDVSSNEVRLNLDPIVGNTEAQGAFIGAKRNGANYNSTLNFGVGGTTLMSLYAGLVVGSPTGGDKGAGTINAVAIYKNGTALDIVFEPDYQMATIDEMTAFYTANKHLPTIPTKEVWDSGSTNMGSLTDRLWETVEVQARYISQLNERIKELEAKNADLEARLESVEAYMAAHP